MPLYGKALKRIRSGVLVPLLLAPLDVLGVLRGLLGFNNVVCLCAFVVSVLGGGGREARSGIAGRMEDRHKKHSPVP
jgi:hypothetical protein